MRQVPREPYHTAPIEEAFVEFRFESSGREWDPTLPGKLHQHQNIGPYYTGTPRTQRVIQADLNATGDKPSIKVQEGVGRIQLVNEQGTRLIALGPDVLSVHTLRPYDRWDAYRPRIAEALAAYTDVVGGPIRVTRIDVRYINKIVLPDTVSLLETYFRCRPLATSGLPSKMGGFISQVEYIYPDDVRLLLAHASIQSAPGQSTAAYLLDLDVFIMPPIPLSVDKAMDFVDTLHEREGEAFEAIITDEARALFDKR